MENSMGISQIASALKKNWRENHKNRIRELCRYANAKNNGRESTLKGNKHLLRVRRKAYKKGYKLQRHTRALKHTGR